MNEVSKWYLNSPCGALQGVTNLDFLATTALQLFGFNIHLMHQCLVIARNTISLLGKKICVRKFHTILNGSFFQRTELPTTERCIEGCIDNIEHCKTALYTYDKTKVSWPINPATSHFGVVSKVTDTQRSMDDENRRSHKWLHDKHPSWLWYILFINSFVDE